MSFLDLLRESTHTRATAFKQFLHRQEENSLHIFFEGPNDPSFYSSFIDPFRDRFCGLHFYDCGKKCHVYDTRKRILQRQKQRKSVNSMICLYFVDKDLSDIFDEWPHESDVHVTDYYAIENYLVTSEMLETVWNEMIIFSGSEKPDFGPVRAKFEMELESFYQFMRQVMVWVIHHRRNDSSPNFRRIKLDKLLAFNDDLELTCLLDGGEACLVDFLDSSTSLSTDCDSFHSEETLIQNMHPKAYIVGKFELWFFREFIKSLVKSIKDMLRIRVSFNENHLGNNSAIRVLGPRMRNTPPSVSDFLERNICIEGCSN
ncbi:MAG: DUF4435 domain-containing protein [Chloroflexota bacterium]|nr:DUF4435 domain-containing protein [Chloroflexota bacterium]